MKRLLSLVLALILLAGVSVASAKEVTFETAYFTLTLPSGWEVENESEKADEDLEFLGVCYENRSKFMAIFAYLVYYEDLKDISLWDADDSQLEVYAQAVLEDYADDNPEWIDTIIVGSIPFILIHAEDEDGEYLYADTMTNGYAIQLEAMILDDDFEKQYPITEGDLALFQSIIETFQPVT